MSLQDNLNTAKEKANLRDFEVTITETLQMKVVVSAKNREEAEEIVRDDWYDSEHILDSSHFTEVKFKAASVKLELAPQNTER